MSNNPVQYFTSLLQLPEEHHKHFAKYVQQMSEATGKTDALATAAATHQEQWAAALGTMGLDTSANTAQVLEAVQKRMEQVDDLIWNYFESPNLSTVEGWQQVVDCVQEQVPAQTRQGFFLKHDVARRLLRDHPPTEIIDYFGYADADELLEKEDIQEVYSALRFAVSGEWNDAFLKLYANLTPDDFEQRQSVAIIMSPDKWFELAREFAKKKLHPNSHLKEMGITFAIPSPEAKDEQLERTLTTIVSLVLHYHFEVHFYANYITHLTTTHPQDFGAYLQQMIMGEVLVDQVPTNGVRVSHQYYTKKEHPKPVGYEPHVMPEPLHWHKGRETLAQMLQKEGSVMHDWASWYTSGQVLDGTLVSLNFEDNVVSDDEQKTYHLYEALWNHMYTTFFSADELEQQLIQHMDTGLIQFN